MSSRTCFDSQIHSNWWRQCPIVSARRTCFLCGGLGVEGCMDIFRSWSPLSKVIPMNFKIKSAHFFMLGRPLELRCDSTSIYPRLGSTSHWEQSISVYPSSTLSTDKQSISVYPGSTLSTVINIDLPVVTASTKANRKHPLSDRISAGNQRIVDSG